MGLYAKTAGALIGLLVLGVLAIVIFDEVWQKVGFGAAIVVLGGAVLFFAWMTDRKDKASRAGLEDI